MKTFGEPIGQRLKRIRTENGFSISEVANTAGIAVSTYREWEHGRQIKGEPYEKIAQALGVTLYELLTGNKPAKLDVIRKIDEIEAACKFLKRALESLGS